MTPSLRRRAISGAPLGLLLGLLVHELGLGAALSYQGGRFVFIVAIAAAGTVLATTRARRALAATVGALALLWLLVALTPLTRLLADGLIRRDPPAPADAVFVLASALQDDGDLSAISLGRLVHGAGLVQDGHAPRLVVANIVNRPSHEAAVRRELDELGVRTELIGLGPVNSTRDEALALAALFRERGWRRVLLVTSPLHSRRAAGTFAAAGLEVISSPSRETLYDIDDLAYPDDRLLALRSVLHERIGLLVYGWRGWLQTH